MFFSFLFFCGTFVLDGEIESRGCGKYGGANVVLC